MPLTTSPWTSVKENMDFIASPSLYERLIAMEQLFATTGLAEGYSTGRPAVPSLVIEKLAHHLKEAPIRVAVDVGCGAGISTRPLEEIAKFVLGADPAASMLHSTSTIAPRSFFIAASAE